MRAAAKTHVGKVRKRNEDYVLADLALGLLVVADGMGGHSGGEIASALAVETIVGLLRTTLPGQEDPAEVEKLVREAVEKAGEAIKSRAAADAEARLTDMGTTLVLALCRGTRISLAHMGDSRAYLIQRGAIRRLTRDHSLVSEMVESGEITPRRARRHPLRNVITRSLGGRGLALLDQRRVEWAPGDHLLLCSDGLTNMVEDEEILAMVERDHGDVELITERLVARANARGGKDNISVILACEG
jgi:serine/threonine protein phosphatase PrpC